jgi:hypothetical protein
MLEVGSEWIIARLDGSKVGISGGRRCILLNRKPDSIKI